MAKKQGPDGFLQSMPENYRSGAAELGYAILTIAEALTEQPGFDREKFQHSMTVAASNVNAKQHPLLASIFRTLGTPNSGSGG
jgi:hypothetical protein